MPSETTSESAARLARIPAQVRHIHLIGVAGSAMAALAGMLAERGLRVTGSDNQLYEPTASLLKRLKIEVSNSFDGANLVPPPDLVVVGNVVTRANPEAAATVTGSDVFEAISSGVAMAARPTPSAEVVAASHSLAKRLPSGSGSGSSRVTTPDHSKVTSRRGPDPYLYSPLTKTALLP